MTMFGTDHHIVGGVEAGGGGGVPATGMSLRVPARLHRARWVAMNNYILNNKKLG